MQHSGLHTTAGSSAAGTEQQRSSRSQQGRRSPLGDAASSPGPDPGIGTIYVQCTKNNTICTLVDIKGMPLAWTSAGSCGFKNARKKSTQVSQTVAEILVQKVIDRGFREVRYSACWHARLVLFLHSPSFSIPRVSYICQTGNLAFGGK